jgi:hypothetical protein
MSATLSRTDVDPDSQASGCFNEFISAGRDPKLSVIRWQCQMAALEEILHGLLMARERRLPILAESGP